MQAVVLAGGLGTGAQTAPMVVIGAGCVIEPGARVAGSMLHDNVRVGAGARVIGSVIGQGSTIAPGAQVTGRLIAAGQ